MKKVIGIFAGCYIGGMAVVLLVMSAVMGGGGGSLAIPPQFLVSEEEAYAYQYIGTELGVPWDIVLMADVMADNNTGPICTALEFCTITEEKYVAVVKSTVQETTGAEEEPGAEDAVAGEEEAGAEEEPETEDTAGAEEEPGEVQEPGGAEAVLFETEWVREEIVTYSGKSAILEYLEMKEEDLAYSDAAGIVVAVNERAEEKGKDNEEYYIATLVSEPDYEDILKNRIELKEDDIALMLDIYDGGYLPEIYGYSSYYGSVELPDIVTGNVSRHELAQVAVSLLGHPYMMGAKSSEPGAPKGPLDCSGFVDWVYVQCFGATVSTGRLPEGVAVSGTAQQWYASEAISASELKIGDLGFVRDPVSLRTGQVNHVGIYLGTYDGQMLWIHCGGSSYGTPDCPKGRVGISKSGGGYNNYNPVTGTTFEPAMKNCRFRYYRRPRFTFTDD